jgi:hypothetical protein
MVSGPAAAWLSGRREDLNARFERMRRRYPRLDPAGVLDLLEKVLPPLAEPAPGSEELLSAVYDLVLLHVARDALATHPGLEVLLRQTFPGLRPLLLERPSALPAALSNAVEGLGIRGPAFAEGIAGVGAVAGGAATLLEAGGVLAWRLGEVRLRSAAMRAAPDLPPRALLAALDLPDWPGEAAPLALAAVRGDAWVAPRDRVADATLAAVPRLPAAQIAELAARLEAPPAVPLGRWRVSARVGDFSGFGGSFDSPPLVLDGGADRHVVYARSGDACFRIDADVFGWSCRVEPGVDLGVRAVDGGGPSLKRLVAKLSPARGRERLAADGTVEVGGEKATFPELAGANAFTVLPSALAASHGDSHRIRILTPRREAV